MALTEKYQPLIDTPVMNMIIRIRRLLPNNIPRWHTLILCLIPFCKDSPCERS